MENKCLVPNCDKPPRALGLCHSHYSQLWQKRNRLKFNTYQRQYKRRKREKARLKKAAELLKAKGVINTHNLARIRTKIGEIDNG